MEQLFYIAIDGKQYGPYTFEELKLKDIRPNTLVWTERLDNWTKAEHIPLLKDIIKVGPPPLPPIVPPINASTPPPTTPPSIVEPTTDKYFGYKLARRRDRFLANLLEGLIIYIPIIVVFILIHGFDYFNDDSDYFSLQTIGESFLWAFFSAFLGAIFYPLWSANLGQKIMGLKVISVDDGKDVNRAFDGAIREFLKSFLSTFIIPVIWLLWDDHKQNLYDKIVRTYVVSRYKQK